ncbi:peptidoglycan-binding protein [Salipaludibacillus keqinensis]|uniref:Peptidoglycan-binding protein n=1 Tax=Salipaludibacillus keqinensis TaxID=2045207 RepID=A0A323TK76_9BACI|nr:peptidoglycan-binding protein [Salipaludibacillus keqinensis]PYZ95199.1 peptidoglycan-binding protein [Salipaludibacillus keqinensis]
MDVIIHSKLKNFVVALCAVLPFFFFYPVFSEAANETNLGDKLLGNGKVHSDVAELQELLDDRGYLEEDAKEGAFDRTTSEAVKTFQEETDIFVDGLAGPHTIGALLILQDGDQGSVVEALQEDLNKLGYYQGQIDGKFGPITNKAVKDFQASHNITVDGLAGPETYGAIHTAVLQTGYVVTENEDDSDQSSSSPLSNKTESKEESVIESSVSESEELEQADEPVTTETSSEPEVEQTVEESEDNKSDESESAETENAENDVSTEQSSSMKGVDMTVEATAYTAYCNGCSGITYTGLDLRNNPDKKVIAVDPNVIPLGSKVYVGGYGTAIAGDTGGAIKGHKIDLFMPNQSDALSFGRQTIQITILE